VGEILLGILFVVGLLLAVSAGFQSVTYYVPYATVGLVLVIRRRGHAIGWLLLILAGLSVTSTTSFTSSGPLIDGTAPIGERILAWTTVLVGPPVFCAYAVLAMVFPSGRLPGGTWGRIDRALIVVMVLVLAVIAAVPTVPLTMADGSMIDLLSPFSFLPPGPLWDGVFNGGVLILLACSVVPAASLAVRLRRAVGVERQQLRWVAASLVLVAAAVTLGVFTSVWLPAEIAFPMVPVAVAIAVLRYRLYEIDRIISRTIAYASLTGILVVVFAGAILVFQAVLAPLTNGNTVAVAASTLIVAALFQPIRRPLQERVDRRFNRARYDADRTLASFAGALREDVDLQRLGTDIRSTVDQTVQPTFVSLWLRR
jgi:hypothetical protein